MKRLLTLLVLGAAMLLTGCGLVHTYPERERRYRNITDYQMRMAVDDWDFFWLMDKQTYMSNYYLRDAD